MGERERELERLKATNAALNEELQACAGKLTEEHDVQGQLNEKIQDIVSSVEATLEAISEHEARAKEIEAQLKDAEAENQRLTAKVGLIVH